MKRAVGHCLEVLYQSESWGAEFNWEHHQVKYDCKMEATFWINLQESIFIKNICL